MPVQTLQLQLLMLLLTLQYWNYYKCLYFPLFTTIACVIFANSVGSSNVEATINIISTTGATTTFNMIWFPYNSFVCTAVFMSRQDSSLNAAVKNKTCSLDKHDYTDLTCGILAMMDSSQEMNSIILALVSASVMDSGLMMAK